MRLLYDRVAVEIEEVPQFTPSGLTLPESMQPKDIKGKVVAIGDGMWQNGIKVPMAVKIGDRVLFNIKNTLELELEGKKVLIMGEASIIAILGE